jgi:choline dehydrogenase-like flavoprotein
MLNRETDVVIVGSGPAGSAVALELAQAGCKVVVLEEGEWADVENFPLDTPTAFARHYRDMGMSVMQGKSMIPYIQGRAVGGSSVINGSISWRLPKDVYEGWTKQDPALQDALPWEEIETQQDTIETYLNIHPTPPDIARTKNLLMAKGAEALGLEHRPINRNVRGCEGLGRCLQGCPKGNRLSTDRTYLLDAEQYGAEIISSVCVQEIKAENGRAVGVSGIAKGGGRVHIKAQKAVVLAASAIQSPVLLLNNRITHGPVGRHLQCHPGVAVTGRFPEVVRTWDGATQGHEVTGLRHEGLKFEVLGFGLEILAGRIPGLGPDFAKNLDDIAHFTNWGVAVRATGEGRVRSFRGSPFVRFQLSQKDLRGFRRGIQVLGEMMFAAGADWIAPEVHGCKAHMQSPDDLAHIVETGPSDPKSFKCAVTHMFGTCRMGSDPAKSVVNTNFEHHACKQLYVADSSVFPSNTGVNPQTSILAFAAICGRRILAA